MRTGFVLSGFASYSASHVGMLRALIAAGKVPDVVVGISIGAGNAAWLAAQPTAAGVERLHRVWLEVGRHDVPPLTPPVAARALLGSLPFHPITGLLRAAGVRNHILPIEPWSLFLAGIGRTHYLVDNRNPRQFLRENLPIRRLERTAIPLCVMAADAETGEPVALSSGDAIPALQASSAVPGVYPSVQISGRALVDGWVAQHTAIQEAVKLGADEVYVLPSGYTCNVRSPLPRVAGMLLHNLNLAIEQRIIAEVAHPPPGVRVHVVPPLCPLPVLPYEFHKSEMVIERATRATEEWLTHGQPVPGLSRPLGPHRHHPPASHNVKAAT